MVLNEEDHTGSFASVVTKSTGGSCSLSVWPIDDRAPLMHWIEDLSSAKLRLHLTHAMVRLYGSSLFWAIMEASLL